MMEKNYPKVREKDSQQEKLIIRLLVRWGKIALRRGGLSL